MLGAAAPPVTTATGVVPAVPAAPVGGVGFAAALLPPLGATIGVFGLVGAVGCTGVVAPDPAVEVGGVINGSCWLGVSALPQPKTLDINAIPPRQLLS
jgi:hypothetical protein